VTGVARRGVLLAGAAALAGCQGSADDITGGFAGASAERGHLLRTARAGGPPKLHRTQVLIAGAGVAGLAAARALRQRGIEDVVVLDLEDAPGGNSRPGMLRGILCPLGAHYLPVPGDSAREVQDLLEEFGLRKRVAGRWTYDERHLCHAPQERLYLQGLWQEGLLPLHGVGATARAQYVLFAREVEAARKTGAFRIPVRAPGRLLAWDGESFAAWLDRRGLTDPHLRWYLDYCCRDDYGAGAAGVAAWAGLHYFAARHGFHPPGADDAGEREAVLTWPEGNGWLTGRLAAPLRDRFRGGHLVQRIAQTRDGIEIDALSVVDRTLHRWQARHCIVALPAFVAARVVENPPAALREAAARIRHAPWVVANLHLQRPLAMGAGMPLAWDNVVYGSQASLGYVVATHQNVQAPGGPTVLSWYHAPGVTARAEVLAQPWTHWRDRVLQELQGPHPDLEDKLTHVEVARYGHAMPVPAPGLLRALPAPPHGARLQFVHSDFSGYSIFEEAFTRGHEAGLAAARA
jgi:monoamine oxidase